LPIGLSSEINSDAPKLVRWLDGATAGIVQPHGCLTVDEMLSHFRQRKPNAHENYSEFVQAGIDNPSIWDDLQAQSLSGVEGFADGIRHLVREKQQIREIPKGQRFVGRPSLEKLFSQSASKASRDQLSAEAITVHGYGQMEVATFLGIHWSTISRILTVNEIANLKKLTLNCDAF
jgi:putative transposase